MNPFALLRLATEARRRMGSWWGGMSLIAGLGFLMAALGVTGFVWIAEEVLEGETSRMDAAVLEWFLGARTGWLDAVALEITALGNIATLVIFGLAAAAILWAAGRRVSVALLATSLVTGTLVSFLLKAAFDRPRPDASMQITQAFTTSFPSGHAMLAAVTYGTVAFLVGRMARGGIRRATWAGAVLLVLLIGLSRLYTGVHHPSDVAAGWLAGLAWTGLLVGLFRVLGAFSGEVPDLARVEPDLDEG